MALYVALIIPNCNESPVSLSIHGFEMEGREINLAGTDPRGIPGPPGVGYYYQFNVLYDTPTLVKIGNLYPPFTTGLYAIGFQSRPGSYAAYLECPITDLSGLYFINPNKEIKADNYYGGQARKIPNPTIRTAPLGE
jgi:hypothetical protein